MVVFVYALATLTVWGFVPQLHAKLAMVVVIPTATVIVIVPLLVLALVIDFARRVLVFLAYPPLALAVAAPLSSPHSVPRRCCHLHQIARRGVDKAQQMSQDPDMLTTPATPTSSAAAFANYRAANNPVVCRARPGHVQRVGRRCAPVHLGVPLRLCSVYRFAHPCAPLCPGHWPLLCQGWNNGDVVILVGLGVGGRGALRGPRRRNDDYKTPSSLSRQRVNFRRKFSGRPQVVHNLEKIFLSENVMGPIKLISGMS